MRQQKSGIGKTTVSEYLPQLKKKGLATSDGKGNWRCEEKARKLYFQ